MKTQLTQLITAFRAININGAITPESLGSLLQKIVDEIPENAGSGGSATPTPSGSPEVERCYLTLEQLITVATVESPLSVDTRTVNNTGKLVSFGKPGETDYILSALQDCYVEITGYVTLKANESYTADRILRWFRLDEDGERYAGAIITTHFTGTTQIFSVPVSYSVKMNAGDTLSLVHYSSSGTSTISANSSLYFRISPV